MVFVSLTSSSSHHHLIIVIIIIIIIVISSSSSSSHHHHHLTIIIIIFSLSLSRFSFLLYFSATQTKNLPAQPLAGKVPVEGQKMPKTAGFCDFQVFGATLCGNPGVVCQKLIVFAILFGRVNPSQGKRR